MEYLEGKALRGPLPLKTLCNMPFRRPTRSMPRTSRAWSTAI